MIRKIATIIFAVAIVVAAVIGFNKLRYWDRSTRIFVSNSAARPFGNRFGGRPGMQGGDMRFGNFGREMNGDQNQGFRNMPDSLRQRRQGFDRGRFPGGPDSLRRTGARPFPGNPGEFGRGGFGGPGPRGGDFRRGSSIRLNNVYWFLAVFSGFVVVTIYLDKLVKYFRNRRKFSRLAGLPRSRRF